jgi:succinate dehydrogenase / fumarate reductase membrane anchor subunit
MLFFIVYLLVHFAVDPPHSWPAWNAWMTSSSVSIATAVFFAPLLAHAWVGLRDVILDYVHLVAVRVCVLALLGIGLVAMGVWTIRMVKSRACCKFVGGTRFALLRQLFVP